MRTAGLSADTLDPSELKPTPHYNMSIMEDMAFIPIHEYLFDIFSSQHLFSELITVAKVRHFVHSGLPNNTEKLYSTAVVVQERSSIWTRFT